MKIIVARKFDFCIGHRILGHESKCSNMHGHNYTLWVEVTSDKLDSIGRVVDFSVIKERIQPWLDTYWDHTFLVYEKDDDLMKIEPIAPKNKPWFVCSFNPTAENMVIYFHNTVFPSLFSDIDLKVHKIKLFESEKCLVEIQP